MNIKVFDEEIALKTKSQLVIDRNKLKGKIERFDNWSFIDGVFHFVAHSIAKAGLINRNRLKTLMKHDVTSQETTQHPLYHKDWNALTGSCFYSPSDSSFIFFKLLLYGRFIET